MGSGDPCGQNGNPHRPTQSEAGASCVQAVPVVPTNANDSQLFLDVHLFDLHYV